MVPRVISNPRMGCKGSKAIDANKLMKALACFVLQNFVFPQQWLLDVRTLCLQTICAGPLPVLALFPFHGQHLKLRVTLGSFASVPWLHIATLRSKQTEAGDD